MLKLLQVDDTTESPSLACSWFVPSCFSASATLQPPLPHRPDEMSSSSGPTSAYATLACPSSSLLVAFCALGSSFLANASCNHLARLATDSPSWLAAFVPSSSSFRKAAANHCFRSDTPFLRNSTVRVASFCGGGSNWRDLSDTFRPRRWARGSPPAFLLVGSSSSQADSLDTEAYPALVASTLLELVWRAPIRGFGLVALPPPNNIRPGVPVPTLLLVLVLLFIAV
mmetsp:Transcript_7623/g.21257  ORF Transcript_7623/g.21257 Transcript_7623/m.21257 type:complete len:227 (-) Transcript_7623:143-823(-)